jgi:cytochrome c553
MVSNTFLSIILFFSWSSVTFADDLELGRQKAKMCVACHGSSGLSKSDDIPSIAGQGERYLIKAMNEFKSKVRQNIQMSMVAETLSDEDIQSLAAYFSSIKLQIIE